MPITIIGKVTFQHAHASTSTRMFCNVSIGLADQTAPFTVVC
ncbi:hypothetical protein AB01_5160 [Escherichia coli 2-177-06_S1_C1]|nr:hypothetical protein AD10_5160 [Escherichia coli 1-182-04_S4_C2]KDW11906.1 hypothetical protein AB01_5160 [Escherichia coli 2-177-06_S1_C1]KDW38193.1 hypothetical protein AB29_5437 [Escherichia coli 2-177-06_S1_C2]